MLFVDTKRLTVIERLPGWKGQYFHSENMTFAHYEFTAGSAIQWLLLFPRTAIIPSKL
jgi:hypothetical protein